MRVEFRRGRIQDYHTGYRNIEELLQYLLQCLLTSKEVLNYSVLWLRGQLRFR